MTPSLQELMREALKQHPSFEQLEEVIYKEALLMYLNVSRAAHALGRTRRTLENKMRQYNFTLAELTAEKEKLRSQLVIPGAKSFRKI